MYSPNRVENSDSPLKAFSPIVNVIKTAQSNATKDFDRFYNNLRTKLTPKTSNSRIQKKTSETKDGIKHMLEQKRNHTSLTPLIERHLIGEGSQQYTSRNPFYQQDSDSDITDREETPGLDEAESTTSSHSSRRRMPFNLNARLAEERKRMDKLQQSVTKLKRQSSFLAEESLRLANFIFGEDGEEKEEEEVQHTRLHTPYAQLAQDKRLHTPRRHHTQLATPPQSIDYNNIKNPQKTPRSPTTDHYTESSTPKRMAITPKRVAFGGVTTPTANISPKRIIIDTIPNATLRSTEMVSTPGGTLVSNRFWKEIHASPTSSPMRPVIEKRISTMNHTWANDDQFWSASSSNAPMASSFNNKLFKVAQQEKKQHDDNNWSIRSAAAPRPATTAATSLRPSSLYRPPTTTSPRPPTTPLSDELESAKKRDEIIKRNNIPTMNPNLLAELKAKHDSKFIIDDSDSYKFNK